VCPCHQPVHRLLTVAVSLVDVDRYDAGFIFELLWRSRNTAGKRPRVSVPETIVFRNNQPTGWYFTHEGQIMKRSLGQEHFITNKKVAPARERGPKWLITLTSEPGRSRIRALTWHA